MQELQITESAVSVLVEDYPDGDDLYERMLTIADNEGFKGDRRIFQEFLDLRAKAGEKLSFDYGFSWLTFDRVEAGWIVRDDAENNIEAGYSVIIGVNPHDELTMDCALLLTETFQGKKYRYINVCGPSFATDREIFGKKFIEQIEVFSSFLGSRRQNIIEAYEKAKVQKVGENLDKLLLMSHLAQSVRDEVRKNLENLEMAEITQLDVAREFSSIGNARFAHQGNRYYEAASRILHSEITQS
ncbi:MAG: hypothetical protein K8S87_04775 [Planctomycetes bacterium]|nr:hypothetical protein [Planctomycetota bacterium]